MHYCGRVCPKCGKGCNSENPVLGLEDIKKRLKARFGNLPCNDCLIDSVGGVKEYDKIRSQEILKEMGIGK